MTEVKTMTQHTETSRPNRLQLYLCLAAAVLAITLSVVTIVSYNRSVSEKNALISERETLTARKKAIDKSNTDLGDQQGVLEDMVTSAKTDAEHIDTIPNIKEKIEKYTEYCAKLQKRIDKVTAEIEEIKAAFPEGYLDE